MKWTEKRSALCFLVGMMMVLAMVLCTSCADGAAEGEAPVETLLSAEDFSDYRIVRPDIGTEAEVSCGILLKDAFEAIGMNLKLDNDFYKEGVEQFAMREHEILVGNTNRPESVEFLNQLQLWQYGYAYRNGKIVIAGHSDETLTLAVEAFVSHVLSRDSLFYTAEDDYLYGSVKEGKGRTFSLVSLTVSDSTSAERAASVLSGSDEAEETEERPEVALVQCADSASASRFLDALGEESGYAAGADFSSTGDGMRYIILYREELYTLSSAALSPLSYQSHLAEEERGAFAYCVLRFRETGQKMVFCTVDLGEMSGADQEIRLELLGQFAENCDKIPVLIGGRISKEAADSVLYAHGQADFARLSHSMDNIPADEESGIYGSYGTVVPMEVKVEEAGMLRCSFQLAK